MGGSASVLQEQQQHHARDLNHSHSDEYNRLAASVLSDAETLRSRRGSVTGRERHGSISHEVTVKSLALLQLSHNLQSNKSFDHENADKPLISRDVSAERTIPRNRSRDVVISNHNSREKEDKEGGTIVLPKLPPKKYNNKKPNLNIRVTSDSAHSDDSLFEGLANNSSGKSTQRGPSAGIAASGGDRETVGYGGSSPPRRPSTPHVPAIVSPSGTVHVGHWNINEDGLSAAAPPATIRLPSTDLDDSMEGRIIAAMNNADHPAFSHQFLSSGRCDFVEIGTLGNGASGSVVEAIHVPTLTLVALKMLPIYQADKLQNISRELNVLYQNLAELKLVDDSLEDVNSPTPPGGDFVPLIDKKFSGSGSTVRSRPSPPVSRKTSPQNSFKGNSPPLPRSRKTSPQPSSGKQSTNFQSTNTATSTTLTTQTSEKMTTKRTPPSGNLVQMSACPQMLSLYDAFTNPKSGMVNLVVEYMDGGSLQDLVMHGGCADEEVLADIAYQVLSGLSFLHSNNQMHRDIKPGNILLSCRGVIKLADFGISRALDGSYKMANTFIGTMCYMAPERIGGENYGFPSDVWSFGLTLLAVAKGQFPLSATDGGYWGLLKAICDEDPPSPGPHFSEEFNDFVGCCLRKDPHERSSPTQLLQHPFIAQYIDDFEDYDSPRRRLSFFSHPPKTVRSATTDGSTVMSRTSSSVSENNYSTPLSKLASRRYRHSSSTASCDNIPEHAIKTYRSAAISALEAKDGGLDAEQLALAQEEEDALVEAMVERIRMDHLTRILEKIEMKYESLEKVVYDSDSSKDTVCNCSSGDQSSVRTSTSSQRYNLELIEEARRTLRVRIPNFETGQHQWRHLASQLMLPEEVVLDAARRHLSNKYLDPCK